MGFSSGAIVRKAKVTDANIQFSSTAHVITCIWHFIGMHIIMQCLLNWTLYYLNVEKVHFKKGLYLSLLKNTDRQSNSVFVAKIISRKRT